MLRLRSCLVVATLWGCGESRTPADPPSGGGASGEAGSPVAGAATLGGGGATGGGGLANPSQGPGGGAAGSETGGADVGGTGGGSGGGPGGTGGGGGGASGFPSQIDPISLSTDAGYCWFEDRRALFVGERLLVGTVASGWADPARRGDIEAIVYDFDQQKVTSHELHDRLELDDHDSPAFLVRPDGRVLTLYAKHGTENHFYYRASTDASLLTWGAEQTFAPTSSTRLTYSNLFLLPAENNRIYDFYRGLNDSYKPSFAYSDDAGQTWTSGNIVINVPSAQKHRPYVRYASNGTDTVHLLYTEAHPRDFDNSLYHVYYKAGQLHASNGTQLRALSDGLSSPDQGTRIFQGSPDQVAWGVDVVVDDQQRPVAVYSVQMGSAGLPTGQGGDDIRYRYARWDGSAWRDNALAYAGSKLYSGEDDYSGLVAIDPEDPNVVFISTNANPSSGAPLISASDGARHYEIFRGTTANGGQTWQWAAVTRDSAVDNLRPLVPPASAGGRRALLWLRGKYVSYTNYQQELVAVVWRGEP
jgi:hypothetical protein